MFVSKDSVALDLLLLEDTPDDAALIENELTAAGYDVRAEVVQTREAFADRLRPEIDVILSDHALPQFDALQALDMVKEADLDIPFIIVSGVIQEETAIEAMRRGAADYLLKDRLARLAPAVQQALREKQHRVEKQRAFEAIRRSEAFNRSVLASLSAHIAVLDRAGSIVSVNEAWNAFSIENGNPLLERVGPCTNYLTVCQRAAEAGEVLAAQAHDGIQAVLNGQRELFLLEYPCHSPKEQRWFLMRVTPLAGDVRGGAVVAHEDITERKRAEENVRASEARYRLLAEHATDVIARIGLDGTCLYVSPSCQSLLGYEPEELLRESAFAIVHPDDVGRLQEGLAALSEQAFEPRVTYRARRKDGSYVWIEANSTLVRDASGRTREIVTVLRDTTERRQAHEELQASEARWRGLVEYHPDPILISKEGRIVYLSPAGARFLGLASAEEVLDVPLARFVAPDLHETLEAQLRAVADGVPTKPTEYRVQDAEGEERIVEAFSVPVIYQGERCVQSVVRDVTDRHEYEARLIEARDRAEEMARLKSSFLDNMSHEIRTPLTGIIGYSDLLIDETAGEVQQLARTIRSGGHRLLAMLDSVMELAQIESRTVTFEATELDLVEEVERLLPSFERRARGAGLYLRLEPEEPRILVTADRTALLRVLSHLLDNAVKYTKRGGITVALDRSEAQVRIQIRDTGIGIGPDFVALVFSEFQQESDGLAREYEGVGVGLAITKGLVERMGGTVEVESEKGVGTTFTVGLPAQASAPDALRLPPPA